MPEGADTASEALLAALLHAIAQMTGDQGRQMMESLAAVAVARGTDDSRASMPELAAMTENPGDETRARDLARAFQAQADSDEASREDLARWRGRPEIQALERHLTRIASLSADTSDLAGSAHGAVQAKHAFISYVREDSGHVDRLQAALETAGIRVWRDTASLWPGEDWRQEIRRAITSNALAFLACFSQHSLTRERSFQREELILAIEELRTRHPDRPWLIPVRFDDCPIPDQFDGPGQSLASFQRADLFGEHLDEETARLVTAVTRILEPTASKPDPGAPVPAAGPPHSPGQSSEQSASPQDRRWRAFWTSLWTITILGGAVTGLIVWAITTGALPAGNRSPQGSGRTGSPARHGRSSASAPSLEARIGWCCQLAAAVGLDGYIWTTSYKNLRAIVKAGSLNLANVTHAGIGQIEISLQTDSAEPIYVAPPEVIVQGRARQPSRGLLLVVDNTPQGAGEASQFTADLDEPHPVTVPYTPGSRRQLAGNPAIKYFYVSRNSPEIMILQVVDHDFFCNFSILLKWQSGGHVYRHLFVNDGRPFTIAGSAGLRNVTYNPIVGTLKTSPSPAP